MANAVLPTMEKLLPPADTTAKRPQPKQSSESSFDTALSNARPKPAAQEKEKPEAKKATRATKRKGETAKPQKVSKKENTDAEAEDVELEGHGEEATSEESQQEDVPTDPKAPAGKGQKQDAKAQGTDQVLISDQNGQAAAQAAPVAAAANQQAQAQTQTQEQSSDAPVKTEGKKGTATAQATTPLKAVKKSPNQAAAKQAKANPEDAAIDEQETAAQDSSDSGDDADQEDSSLPGQEKTPQAVTKTVAQHPAQHGQAADTVDAEAAPQLQAETTVAPPTATAAAAGQDDDQSVQAVDTDSDRPQASPQIDAAVATAHAAANTALTLDVSPKAPAAQAPAPVHAPPQPPAPPVPPEVRFAEANHPQIVSGIRGQLLPDGGTMHIRLDPPELGALQVSIHMQDGVMSASFQTSNDEATKVLSHSLAQLKHVLEGQGVSVDKLHVTQAPRDQKAGSEDNGQKGSSQDNSGTRQEQQRREMLQRMWRRLTDGSDPLDMVA